MRPAGSTAHPCLPRAQHPPDPHPAVLAPLFQKQCMGRLHSLHVLLFNTGQITREPLHGLRSDVI